MKKIFPFIATLLLLNGCTLSMEDFSIPEEERGMDEAYTEHTDFGDITYQFADSVLSLTENLQDQYLVHVGDKDDELADSVIYISGDIPKNYRPYIGQKIYAGFSYNFPQGFAGRVVAVENQNGIYRVTTEKVTKDDIFKTLDYKMDYEGEVKNTSYFEDLNDTILDMLGYSRLPDSTLVDWNVYDSVQAKNGNEKAKARLRRRMQRRTTTRALDEDGYGIDDKVEASDGLQWAFDTRSVLTVLTDNGKEVNGKDAVNAAKTLLTLSSYKTWKKIYDDAVKPVGEPWYKDWNPYAALSFKVKHYVHSHTERRQVDEYEENWNETWSVLNIALDMGFSRDFAEEDTDFDEIDEKHSFYQQMLVNAVDNSDDKKEYKRQYKELVKKMKEKKEYKKWTGGKKKNGLPIKGFHFENKIPVSPWFMIQITIDGTPTLSLAGCFTVEMEYTTAKRKEGTKTYGDKEYHIDEQTAPSKKELKKVGGEVTVEVGYTFRAGVDFLVCSTAGISLGANLEIKLTVKLGLDIYNNEKEGEEAEWFKFSGNIEFHVDFWVDLKFIVKPLGFSLWEQDIADFPDPHVRILKAAYNYSPQVSFGKTWFDWDDTQGEEGEGLLEASIPVTYDDLDGVNSLLSGSSFPMMKMYIGPKKDNNYVFMNLLNKEGGIPLTPQQVGRAKEGEEYFYHTMILAPLDTKEIHFVPTLVTFDNRTYLLSQNWTDNVKNHKEQEIEVDAEAYAEVGKPNISTLKSMQIEGGENFDFSAEDEGRFMDENGKTVGSAAGFASFGVLHSYKFLHKIYLYNAYQMSQAGVQIKLYNVNKKCIKSMTVPIMQQVSGNYTFIFHFITNWTPISSAECMYYSVMPFWVDKDSETGDTQWALDSKSKKLYKLEYEMEPVEVDEKNKSKWGTVMPEVSIL